MNELLSSVTSLPNLHPAVVHFPIALLPMAVLLDLMLAGFKGQRAWLERAAVSVYAAAGLGAGLAFWAGGEAVDSLAPLPLATQLHVNEHSDSALYTVWLIGILCVGRAALAFLDRQVARRGLRLGVLLVALVAVGMVFRTADLGGALVYQHGVGVASTFPGSAEAPVHHTALVPAPESSADGVEAVAAMSRLTTSPDGTLEWTPLSGDEAAAGAVLSPAAGTASDSASWTAATDGAAGLRLTVSGLALLVLPGSFGDVQVEAQLDLGNFIGEVGVAHHVESAEQAGFLTVSVPSNEYMLGRLEGSSVKQLGRSTGASPSGPIRLTVSAIGRHFKGLVDDELVVHGHTAALPDGSVGLLLRGEGSVQVISLRVIPVEG